MLFNSQDTVQLAPTSASAHADGSLTGHVRAAEREFIDLVEFWSSLISGKVKLTGDFCSDQRHFVTFNYCQTTVHPLTLRRASCLERCLLGEGRKSIAIEVGLSTSSLADGMRKCLSEMGIPTVASRAPMFLVVAAHASRGQGKILKARLSRGCGGAEHTLSIPRPDAILSDRLPSAELSVARLLAERSSCAEIAQRRATSARTTANQVASIFRKLGVADRSEFMHYLVLACAGDSEEYRSQHSEPQHGFECTVEATRVPA